MIGVRRHAGSPIAPRWLPFVLFVLTLGALAAVVPSAGAGRAAVPESPTLILLNGVIYTGDTSRPRVQAVAIRGEIIVAAGATSEMRSLAGPGTRIVDLQGRFAMPGFNDAHIHLASGGQAKLAVDLEGTKSLEELQQRIRARLGEFERGEWVTGRGWDHTLWPENRFPTRADLDAISSKHPM